MLIILLVPTLLASSVAATASDQQPSTTHRSAQFAIEGFRFAADGPVSPDLRRSLEAQVRIVTQARLKPDILAVFRQRPIRLVASLGQPGVTGPDGVTLEMTVQPEQNPVLLHEFIHLYHLTYRPRDPTIRAAYQAALASGRWPARAYMLTNPREFFAMTASVLLHGRAARPPFTAAAVREGMPDFARWIEHEFRGD